MAVLTEGVRAGATVFPLPPLLAGMYVVRTAAGEVVAVEPFVVVQ